MKIFKFLQGLVGFGNLRFAEIKSCPSASPTYELRKVEISSKNDLAKLLQSGKKHKKLTNVSLYVCMSAKNSKMLVSFYVFFPDRLVGFGNLHFAELISWIG